MMKNYKHVFGNKDVKDKFSDKMLMDDRHQVIPKCLV